MPSIKSEMRMVLGIYIHPDVFLVNSTLTVSNAANRINERKVINNMKKKNGMEKVE